ncbi:hypothetical protein B0J14DRAFT_670666 [Halenospora varia]|nr:hypothetical protein B0J14DRAFT_670666 [Halenospora varia]
MANIVALLSQYELLKQITHFLSALDLFYLASTNSELYNLIRKTEPIFDRLKSVTLCDGHGLKMRQEFRGIYELRAKDFVWGKGRKAHYDEELEVRECRYVPRVRDTPRYRSCRSQHHLSYPQPNNIICFCAACDVKVKRDLPLSLSEYCDCDQYTRWICLPCGVQEDQMNQEYFKTRTKTDQEWAGDLEEGMWQSEVLDNIAFWCSWCKRRHNLILGKTTTPIGYPFLTRILVIQNLYGTIWEIK